MAHSAEFSGKKVEDAINEGLKSLGVTIDEVEVEILSQGGFLKKAKVRLTIEASEKYKESGDSIKPDGSEKTKKPQDKPSVEQKKDKPAVKEVETVLNKPNNNDTVKVEFKSESKSAEVKDDKSEFKANKPALDKTEDVNKAKFHDKASKFKSDAENAELMTAAEASVGSYLDKTLSLMGVEAEVKRVKGLNFEIVTTDNAVVGYRGETLDALQYLTRLSVNKGDERFMRVSLDSNGYRAKREATLIGLAHKMAEKCVKQGHKVVLEPMESVDRHTVHAALGEDERVFTKSEGHEPNRRVVIMVKRDKK